MNECDNRGKGSKNPSAVLDTVVVQEHWSVGVVLQDEARSAHNFDEKDIGQRKITSWILMTHIENQSFVSVRSVVARTSKICGLSAPHCPTFHLLS